MIGCFLIALVLFFIIAFIILLVKRKKEDMSEIESSDSEGDITSDSLPLMASEVIIDNDIGALPEAVDLTPGLPPPEDQGDLGADTSIAVCSAMDYLANAIDPGYNQADNTPDPTPDPIDNSSSNNNESSNFSDYGSSSDYGSTSSGGRL